MNENVRITLERVEPHLRSLLPSELYTQIWLDPTEVNLKKTQHHLARLHAVLTDYIPRVAHDPVRAGSHRRWYWLDGTFLFTDLSGFTSLVEAYAPERAAGAQVLLSALNRYFDTIIRIVNTSGGDLLEFTGDAMLFYFESTRSDHPEVQRALNAALNMQSTMADFQSIETPRGKVSLTMRVGLHTGQGLLADIGTPARRDRVLFGSDILKAKQAEQNCKTGSVSLTQAVYERLKHLDQYYFWQADTEHWFVERNRDHSGEKTVIPASLPVQKHAVFAPGDDAPDALIAQVEEFVAKRLLPLAAYLPESILRRLVDSVAKAQVPSDFTVATVMFVNLVGISERVDQIDDAKKDAFINGISELFSHVNAAVETHGGVLKKMTYNATGSDLMIFFGVPALHSDDCLRAAETALIIRDIIERYATQFGDDNGTLRCQIGISVGSVFAAEIGSKAGRREFNVIGDVVNIAARLASKADQTRNEILISDYVYFSIAHRFECTTAEEWATIKGKNKRFPIFRLQGMLKHGLPIAGRVSQKIDLSQVQVIECLKNVFPTLNDVMLDYIYRTSRFVTYPANTVLCRQGEIEQAFYILVTGEVDIFRYQDGVRVHIGTLEHGESFGEIALILNSPRTADIETRTAVSVIEVERRIFENYLNTQPEIIVNITRLIIGRMLNQEQQRLGELAAIRKQTP
jgi:adenylate cyclase